MTLPAKVRGPMFEHRMAILGTEWVCCMLATIVRGTLYRERNVAPDDSFQTHIAWKVLNDKRCEFELNGVH